MERRISSRIRETLSPSEVEVTSKWDFNYCELARHISSWSKDPSTSVGAVTVGAHGQILSQGYNGFPRGIADNSNRLYNRDEKYKYIVHAEMNCIYNASLTGVSLKDSTLYVYGLPVCSECAKGVIQVGIRRVVIYTPDVALEDFVGKWQDSFVISRSMFLEVGLDFDWYDSNWHDANKI